VVQWLLGPDSPAVRYLALRDLVGLGPRSPRLREARAAVAEDPRVRDLLAGQREDGGFSRHPYEKWGGAHWRLVSLVDLGMPTASPGMPPGPPACLAAAETVLAWRTRPVRRNGIKTINGRVRRCGSQEGNALGVCVSRGMAKDPRAAEALDVVEEPRLPQAK
jgi:hypothetical protein